MNDRPDKQRLYIPVRKVAKKPHGPPLSEMADVYELSEHNLPGYWRSGLVYKSLEEAMRECEHSKNMEAIVVHETEEEC